MAATSDLEVHALVRKRRRRDGFIDGRLSVLDCRSLSIPCGGGLVRRGGTSRTLVMWVRSVDADLFLECEAYHGQAFALTGAAPHKPRGGGRKGSASLVTFPESETTPTTHMVSSFSLTASANSRFESSSSCSSSSSTAAVVVVPSSGFPAEHSIPAQTLNSTLLASRCCIEFSSRAISASVQFTLSTRPWTWEGRRRLTSSQEFRFELTQLRERDGLGVPWRVVHAVEDALSSLSLRFSTQRLQSRSREVNTEQVLGCYTALTTPQEVGLHRGIARKSTAPQECSDQRAREGVYGASEGLRQRERSDGAHF